MAKKAKGFSLANTDQNQSFELGKEKKTDAKAEIDKLAEGDQPIRLDIDAVDLVKLEKKAKDIDKKGQGKKIKYMKAYKDLHRFLSFGRRVPIREKQTFYELVAVMIEAGIPIVQTIKVYADQTTHKYFQKVCRAIAYQLEQGQKFSDTLADYPKIFSESERGIISAAEATGRIVEAFRRLGSEVEKTSTLRGKVRSALIYPTTVILFVIITVFILMRFVIPQISQLFTESNLELPLVTQIVIEVSQFFVDNGLLVVGSFIGFFLLNYLAYQVKRIRYYYHYAALKTPIFGNFIKDYSQAAFTRSLANLIASGVSIVQTLNITAVSMGNMVYQQKIKLLAKDVARGIGMGDSMANSPYFSNMLVNMIAVGEQTAQVDSISLKIADYYTEKVYSTAENFSKLLQPLVIGVVGGIVGLIVLAIMLPMSEILTSVGAF